MGGVKNRSWDFVKVTVSDVDDASKAFAEARAKVKKLNAQLTDAKEAESKAQAKFLDCLDMIGKTNWTAYGKKFETATRKFYTMPKDVELKEKLFDWIEKIYDKETRDAYCTINSMAFNSLMNQHEDAKPDFINEPYEKVTIRVKTVG